MLAVQQVLTGSVFAGRVFAGSVFSCNLAMQHIRVVRMRARNHYLCVFAGLHGLELVGRHC